MTAQEEKRMRENRIPYGLLTDDEKEVFDAARKAGARFHYWSQSTTTWISRCNQSSAFHADSAYRLVELPDPLKANPIILKIDSLEYARELCVTLGKALGTPRNLAMYNTLRTELQRYVDIKTPKD